MTIAAIGQVRTRDTGYSRYAADQAVIRARLAFAGPVDGGETVRIALVRDGTGATVATKTVALATVLSAAQRLDLSLDLRTECWDPRYLGRTDGEPDQHVFAARRGAYHLLVAILDAGGATLATASTAPFAIAPVTAKELKEKYLYGLTNVAAEALAPVVAPRLVTGVTFKRIPPEFYRGNYTLAYTAGDHTLSLIPAFPTPGFPTPTVALDPEGAGDVALATDPVTGDYAVIAYDGWDLPAGDVAEPLTIDGAQMLDAILDAHIADAVHELEGLLGFFLEPTRVTTDLPLDPLADVADALPVMYERPADGQWMSVSVPHRPLIAVDHLSGQLNDGQVLDIMHDWRVLNKVGGRISLVPNSGTPFSLMLYGMGWVWFFGFGFPTVPGFWHYDLVAGVADIGDGGQYGILREMIAKRAMVNILTAMGRAYAGGVGNENYSKDGVSASRSYTGSGSTIYAAEIEQHQTFVDTNLVKMKQRVLGIVHISFR